MRTEMRKKRNEEKVIAECSAVGWWWWWWVCLGELVERGRCNQPGASQNSPLVNSTKIGSGIELVHDNARVGRPVNALHLPVQRRMRAGDEGRVGLD